MSLAQSSALARLHSHLADTLERALKSRFYAEFLRGRSSQQWVEQWQDIPFTHKSHLMDHSPDGFLALPREAVYHYHESFGTVGTPMSSWFTQRDIDYLPGIAGHWAEPFGRGKIILNRFPYSFAVPAALVESIARQKGGVVIPASNLNWNVTYGRALELIVKMQPQIICSLPMEPMLLWQLSEHLKIPREKLQSLEHICLSGGILTPAMRERLEKTWRAKVWNVYGSTEASGLASSCGGDDLYLHHDSYFFEIVSIDPPYQPIRDGEDGVLVVTTLTREAMPLVRYFTRDIVRRTGETTIRLLGRLDDTVEFQNKRIFKYDLEQAILGFGEIYNAWVYFVVVTRKGLHVRLETAQNSARVDENALATLSQKLGVPVRVELVAPDTLLHRGPMLKTPKVFKPQSVSDWRGDGRQVLTVTDALIEWPKYSGGEIAGFLKRLLSNRLARWRIS